jgi:hypothetical protein
MGLVSLFFFKKITSIEATRWTNSIPYNGMVQYIHVTIILRLDKTAYSNGTVSTNIRLVLGAFSILFERACAVQWRDNG